MQPIMTSYPAVRFLVRHGGALAILAAILPLLAGICAVVTGWGWPWLLVGVIAALFLFLMMRSYVELVRIVADTLLPR